MGKNIFSNQQFNTAEINKLKQVEQSEQSDKQVLQQKDASSIFAGKIKKEKIDDNDSSNPLLKGLSFGMAQGGLSGAKRISSNTQNVNSIQPNNGISRSASIFSGGNTSLGLQLSSVDRTSIFSNVRPTGDYALYNRTDYNFKAHKLTDEEVAAQKGLTGEKRTNPKPYGANYELKANPYSAYRENNPEFLQKPDAMEMLNPKNWFKKS